MNDRKRRYRNSAKGKATQALYRNSHREQLREYSRNWIKANPENHCVNEAKYWRGNREKKRAHNVLAYAIRHGKITRQPCEVCGDAKSHGHHRDYSKPLEATWLCALCHALVHRLLEILLPSKGTT